ncbi:hypothetical protein [Streptomyces sp. CBMA156]|nr:hypothetical protein [Streptomyces sp. CBMA156]
MQLHLARGRCVAVTVAAFGDDPGTVAAGREFRAGRGGRVCGQTEL